MKPEFAPPRTPWRPSIRRLAAAALTLATLSSAPAETPTPTPTQSAGAFVDSIAVNTHVNYTDTAYADVRRVADDLAWLGLHHVRDAAPVGAAPLSSYQYLAQRGVRFDFIVDHDVTGSLRQIDLFNAAAPGSVDAVEGFNEINNWPPQYGGLKGNEAGLAAQKAIYAHVHGQAGFAGVAVYDLTGYEVAHVDTRRDAADFANQHVYPQNGEQPAYNANGDRWIDWGTSGLRKFRLPLVITEFGYFTIPQSGWIQIGVDEPSQAKGLLNGLMDMAKAGAVRTYIYELLDQKPDPQNRNNEMHYGLFRNDNSPKPAANAIRNLTSILRAQRPQAVAGTQGGAPAYSLTGLPVSGNSLALRKDDGRLVLVLWNEVPFWDRATGTPLDAAPVGVQVDFERTASRIDVYDPLVSDAPLATHRDVRGMAVDVPDHPVMLEVTFAGTQPT